MPSMFSDEEIHRRIRVMQAINSLRLDIVADHINTINCHDKQPLNEMMHNKRKVKLTGVIAQHGPDPAKWPK